MIRAVRSEALKLATLPSTWVATALIIGIPMLLAAVNANFLTRMLSSGNTSGLLSISTVDEGFGQLTFGLVGVAVLAVTSVSSEYLRNAQTVGAGRQISTTSIATPRRLTLLSAKLTVLTCWVTVLSAVAIPLTVTVSRTLLGQWAVVWSNDFWSRGINAAMFWIGMSWIAFAITCLLRNGILPLALLITNASMVSFSLLAARATSLAKYLPDLAAYSSFISASPLEQPLSPTMGLVVLGVWALGSVLIASVVFVRRDI